MPCNENSDTRSNDGTPRLGSEILIDDICYSSGDGLASLGIVLLQASENHAPTAICSRQSLAGWAWRYPQWCYISAVLQNLK